MSTAEARVEEQAEREAALRREWAGKTKAAEWALKAHRDKQVSFFLFFAQNSSKYCCSVSVFLHHAHAGKVLFF